MSALIRRIFRPLKSLAQLGPQAVLPYAWYRWKLHSGWLRRATPLRAGQPAGAARFRPLPLPAPASLQAIAGSDQRQELFNEAREIVSGHVRLFGGQPTPILLVPQGPLVHWTEYELGRQPWGAEDVKLIWEPCRFGWAFTLGRAYHLAGDDLERETFAQAFWQHAETFLEHNPTNLGPNWASAQEVALRLMAFAFALSIFERSPHTTPARLARLTAAIADHAARISPSLAYARAQNNNHLLSEAAGLLTAAAVLPGHSSSKAWHQAGWRWFHQGLQSQISEKGTYMQHSTNYHRLMLQLALWVAWLEVTRPAGIGSQRPGEGMHTFPPLSASRLAAATRWLQALYDPTSGRAANLGPNDGAYIFPLSQAPFHDYRPVLQASAIAFTGRPILPPGCWDEMAAWFGLDGEHNTGLNTAANPNTLPTEPGILHSPGGQSWAYLRAARFTSRPGHADQLHMDLWWRGLNLAQDAGTYSYNAPPPWENALSHTGVHNTVTVGGQDQMTWAGRFLWLDWAQAQVADLKLGEEGLLREMTAQHNGYRRLGLLHRRRVTAHPGGSWTVVDQLLADASGRKPTTQAYTARLHWLLPDWDWEIDSQPSLVIVRIQSPYEPVTLQVSADGIRAGVVRAGERLYGSGDILPSWGWVSPTYSCKAPALSCEFEIEGQLPLAFTSRWLLPGTGG